MGSGRSVVHVAGVAFADGVVRERELRCGAWRLPRRR